MELTGPATEHLPPPLPLDSGPARTRSSLLFPTCQPFFASPPPSRLVSKQHNYHSSQVPPEWHSWLTHIRSTPPTEDPLMIESHQPWQVVRAPPVSPSSPPPTLLLRVLARFLRALAELKETRRPCCCRMQGSS